MIEAHRFDAMVCIPNCDKIVPGMLLAAMRVNIPTIFVSGGAMAAGKTPEGETLDLISVFEGVGAFSAGKIDEKRLLTLEKFACPSCGSCSGMFTANSMNCLMEAIGLALPYNGSALAKTPEREALAKKAAAQVMVLIGTRHQAARHCNCRKRLTMPSRWIWQWAAHPTRYCIRWHWQTKPEWIIRLLASMLWRKKSRISAKFPRLENGTWKMSIVRAVSQPF